MNNLLNRASNVRKYYFISFKLQSKYEIILYCKIFSNGVVLQKCIWILIDSYTYLQAFLKL